MKIKNAELEKIFGRKVIANVKVLGFDTASRTGWCRIETGKTESEFTFGFVDVQSKDLYYKYDQCIDIFASLITDVDTVVIEETYFSRNANVFRMLSRLGGFVYAIAHLKQIPKVYFLTAIQARSRLDFSTNVKKEIVHKEFHRRFKKMTVADVDIVDGIILALDAIFKENKLDV